MRAYWTLEAARCPPAARAGHVRVAAPWTRRRPELLWRDDGRRGTTNGTGAWASPAAGTRQRAEGLRAWSTRFLA